LVNLRARKSAIEVLRREMTTMTTTTISRSVNDARALICLSHPIVFNLPKTTFRSHCRVDPGHQVSRRATGTGDPILPEIVMTTAHGAADDILSEICWIPQWTKVRRQPTPTTRIWIESTANPGSYHHRGVFHYLKSKA